MADLITPYSSILEYTTKKAPSWLKDQYEGQRILSYDFYDDIFHNTKGEFTVLLRGSDGKPILVPTSKRVINTLARYVGRDWGYTVMAGVDENGAETPEEQVKLAMQVIGDFFEREDLQSKYASSLPEWLRRGDWVWYLQADPLKPAGRKISMKTVDPRTYFQIPDESPDNDPDRISGAFIAEQVLLDDGKTYAMKVQKWVKPNNKMHPSYGVAEPEEGADIFYSSITYELASWDAVDVTKRKVLSTNIPFGALPGIKTLPLYLIKNNAETGNPYGRSDLNGLESVIAGINQAISDEDLALAMAGLGMFWTDAGRPVDENNDPTNWIIGPQRVAEVPTGSTFARLQGITSVDPSQDHVKYLEEQAYGTNGINDIALGTRGAVQESGVALAIRMQPLFEASDKKDDASNGVLNHLFYDLKTWFAVYEGIDLGTADIRSVTSKDRLPFDREQFFKELTDGYLNGWFTIKYVLEQLKAKLGYDDIVVETMLTDLLKQASEQAEAFDPAGARADQELEQGEEDAPPPPE